MSDVGPTGELFLAAKRVQETTIQFSPPYQYDGTAVVLVPKGIWERLMMAIKDYEQHFFGETKE